MPRYARQIEAQASKIQVIPIGHPHSIFHLNEIRFGGLVTLRKILSQIFCVPGKTLVIEELRDAEEIIEENVDIRKVIKRNFRSVSFRLSFFDKSFINASDIKHLENNDFLGYAIVKQDYLTKKEKPSCQHHIYEAVIKKSYHGHNFVRGAQTYRCMINRSPFTIEGYLYAQQNQITNACAHVVLRTIAARFLPNQDLSYREINEILAIDFALKPPGKGLELNGVAAVLKNKHIHSLSMKSEVFSGVFPGASHHQFIYDHIESGYPSIVLLRTKFGINTLHAISIFGHTFNQDIWVHRAEREYFDVSEYAGMNLKWPPKFIVSDSWLSMFIGHDDNMGPNVCIPRHYLQRKILPAINARTKLQRPPLDVVYNIISTLPPRAILNPILAKLNGAKYLSQLLSIVSGLGDNVWIQRLRQVARKGELVLRPLLLNGEQYLTHLKSISGGDGEPILCDVYPKIVRSVSNHPLWMIEVSFCDLFSATKRKVGEVILRSDVSNQPQGDVVADKDVFVLARFPGVFICGTVIKKIGFKDNFECFPSGINDHSQLFGCEELHR